MSEKKTAAEERTLAEQTAVETAATADGDKHQISNAEKLEQGKAEIMKVVEGVQGAEKLAELIEKGKKKGNLSSGELMDVLENMDLESDQMDKIYDTLENLGIDTAGEDYLPEIPDDAHPIEEIEDKYYDLDADIEYVNFVAKPNLGRNAEIAIQGDYSDQYYLYEYVNGDLEPIDADWNEDDGLFEFTASKLTSYVISDKELVAEADEPAEDDEPAADDTTTQNPDTGANDVVGVAVALAAVSLVAAGAVSLKK